MDIKRIIAEAKAEILQEIADGNLKIGEAVDIKGKGAAGISKEYGGGLRIFGTVNGEKRSAKLKKEEIQKWSAMTPQQKEDLYKNYLVTNFDPKAQAKEATVVIPTPNSQAPKDPATLQQAMAATKAGNIVKYVKPGLAEAGDDVKVPTSNVLGKALARVESAKTLGDFFGNFFTKDFLGGHLDPYQKKLIGPAYNKIGDKYTEVLDLDTINPQSLRLDLYCPYDLSNPFTDEIIHKSSNKITPDAIEKFKNLSIEHLSVYKKGYNKNTALPSQELESFKDSITNVYSRMNEAATEPTDAEQEEPAEESGNISDKLSQLISQAIDAAGQVISGDPDKKMESALGKVIKNLTAAQDSLLKVSEHESKLSEKVEAETAKNQIDYNKKFSKGLKSLKVPADLEPKILKLFKLALPAGMKKGVAPDKLAEKLWSHFTLNESKNNTTLS